MKFYRWAPQEISVRLSVAAFPRNFSAKTRNTKRVLSLLRLVLPQNRRLPNIQFRGTLRPIVTQLSFFCKSFSYNTYL